MKVASVQTDVALGHTTWNVAQTIAEMERLAAEGVELAVFPECCLTGYCVDSVEDARRIALKANDASLQTVRAEADRFGIGVVIGFAERDGDDLYNSAAVFMPQETTQIYRKTHLPELGLDRFVKRGDKLDVIETKLCRLGILICFDIRPPEAARTLALKGADLLLVPTNWPEGAEVTADCIAPARASENKVWLISSNRVGVENGFHFIGHSKIVAPTGKPVAAAGNKETTLIADIDPAVARVKRNIVIPGKYETEVFKSRRPDLYQLS